MGTGAATQVARAGGSKEPSKLIGSQSAEHSWAELWTAYTFAIYEAGGWRCSKRGSAAYGPQNRPDRTL